VEVGNILILKVKIWFSHLLFYSNSVTKHEYGIKIILHVRFLKHVKLLKIRSNFSTRHFLFLTHFVIDMHDKIIP
jgi:hypothetical protein